MNEAVNKESQDWDLGTTVPEVRSEAKVERPKYEECESCSA